MEITRFVVVASALLLPVYGVKLTVAPNTEKCLQDNIKAHFLVTVEYEVHEVPGQRMDYVVRDSRRMILAQQQRVSEGEFSFVTHRRDTYDICFISKVPPKREAVNQEVIITLKKGMEARS